MSRSNSSTCSHPSPETTLWIHSCLIAGQIAMLTVGIMLAIAFAGQRQTPLKVEPQRINPNTAMVASLVRLPGIGKARAMDIIHYRQSQDQDEPVFRLAQDLENIRGIGPKTVAALDPWLIFENEQTERISADNGRLGN